MRGVPLGFPVLRVGSYMVVPEEKFIQWILAMRRRTTILGRPRYDPRHYRFAIPNAVLEYKLKPVEFIIFSYLCYCRSIGALAPEEIATGVRMTVGTVKKYLDSLITKKLISEDSAPALKCDTKFFTLSDEIFLLRLPPSAFLVYAYLLLIEDRQSHTCHPSCNTIAAATGISRNTVMKSVGTLLEMGLIAVELSSYFDRHGMKWTLPDRRHRPSCRGCAPIKRRKARDGGEQDKSVASYAAPLVHFCPQCGQFAGDGSGVTNRTKTTN